MNQKVKKVKWHTNYEYLIIMATLLKTLLLIISSQGKIFFNKFVKSWWVMKYLESRLVSIPSYIGGQSQTMARRCRHSGKYEKKILEKFVKSKRQ